MQALSTAVADYEAAFAAIERASPDEGRQCDAAVGPRRLHVLLVQRLRALGLGPILAAYADNEQAARPTSVTGAPSGAPVLTMAHTSSRSDIAHRARGAQTGVRSWRTCP